MGLRRHHGARAGRRVFALGGNGLSGNNRGARGLESVSLKDAKDSDD